MTGAGRAMQSSARRIAALGPTVALTIFAVAARAAPPEAPVEAMHAVLVEVMRDGPTLGFSGRRDRLAPVVSENFALDAISRSIIGDHWDAIVDDKRRRLRDLLADFAIASLASNFDEFDGERFEHDAPTPLVEGVMRVRARLVAGDGEIVQLDYAVREIDGRSRIVNVWFNGVSQSRIQRAEFDSFLRDGRVDALIERMERQIAALARE